MAWAGIALAAAQLLQSMNSQQNQEAQNAIDQSKAGIPKSSSGGYQPTAKALAGTQDADVSRLEQRPPAGDLGAIPQGQRLSDVVNGPAAQTGGGQAFGAQPTQAGAAQMGLADAVKADAQLKAANSQQQSQAGGQSNALGYAQLGAGLLGNMMQSANQPPPQAPMPQPSQAPYTPTATAQMNQGNVGGLSLQEILNRYRQQQGGGGGAAI